MFLTKVTTSTTIKRTFFIREELLKAYLEKNDLALIWAIWGERGYSLSQIDKLFDAPDRPEQTYAVYVHVKRHQ